MASGACGTLSPATCGGGERAGPRAECGRVARDGGGSGRSWSLACGALSPAATYGGGETKARTSRTSDSTGLDQGRTSDSTALGSGSHGRAVRRSGFGFVFFFFRTVWVWVCSLPLTTGPHWGISGLIEFHNSFLLGF